MLLRPVLVVAGVVWLLQPEEGRRPVGTTSRGGRPTDYHYWCSCYFSYGACRSRYHNGG